MATTTVTADSKLSTMSMNGKLPGKYALSSNTQQLLDQTFRYTVGGVEPFAAFFVKAKGVKLWDIDGKEYYDFVSQVSAINQGHNHPAIIKAVKDQIDEGALINISTNNVYWPRFAEMMCKRFGYDKLSAMVSGSEAADLACKVARKWGHIRKGIDPSAVKIFGVGGDYHGVSGGVWNLMDSSWSRTSYGLDSKQHTNVNPSTGKVLAYGDLRAMEECLAEHQKETAAVIMEPMRSLLRTTKEEVDYVAGVFRACKKYNVLFIADEIRQGAGRTGKFFSHQHAEGVVPDLICMGKSMTGGVYPASYVLGYNDTMTLVASYESCSTFASTPPAIAASIAALKVIDDEHLIERAAKIGPRLEAEFTSWKSPHIKYARFTGGDGGLFLNETEKVTARKLGTLLLRQGVLTVAYSNKIRIAPPLTITDEQLDEVMAIFRRCLEELESLDDVPGSAFGGIMAPHRNASGKTM